MVLSPPRSLGVAVDGLSITVADAATKGTIQTDTPTAPSPTRQFNKGQLISIVPASAFATAGAVNGNLLVRKSNTEAA